MNTEQENRLQAAAAGLSRADDTKNRKSENISHKAIKRAVTEIFKSKIDVPTVLQVEKILNNGYANMAGIKSEKSRDMAKLAERAAVGFDLHKQFEKDPQGYVASIEMANRHMGKFQGEGKRFSEDVAIDPIRAAFTQLRKQLIEEIQQISPNEDKTATDQLRFDATIKAERLFFQKYLDNRANEPEQKKQEHLQEFEKRMQKEVKRLEPKEQEKQQERQRENPQERQRELPKQEEKQQERKPIERTPEPPKRSRGLSR